MRICFPRWSRSRRRCWRSRSLFLLGTSSKNSRLSEENGGYASSRFWCASRGVGPICRFFWSTTMGRNRLRSSAAPATPSSGCSASGVSQRRRARAWDSALFCGVYRRRRVIGGANKSPICPPAHLTGSRARATVERNCFSPGTRPLTRSFVPPPA